MIKLNIVMDSGELIESLTESLGEEELIEFSKELDDCQNWTYTFSMLDHMIEGLKEYTADAIRHPELIPDFLARIRKYKSVLNQCEKECQNVITDESDHPLLVVWGEDEYGNTVGRTALGQFCIIPNKDGSVYVSYSPIYLPDREFNSLKEAQSYIENRLKGPRRFLWI